MSFITGVLILIIEIGKKTTSINWEETPFLKWTQMFSILQTWRAIQWVSHNNLCKCLDSNYLKTLTTLDIQLIHSNRHNHRPLRNRNLKMHTKLPWLDLHPMLLLNLSQGLLEVLALALKVHMITLRGMYQAILRMLLDHQNLNTRHLMFHLCRQLHMFLLFKPLPWLVISMLIVVPV